MRHNLRWSRTPWYSNHSHHAAPCCKACRSTARGHKEAAPHTTNAARQHDGLVVAGIAVAGGIAYKAAVHLSGQAEESLKAAREAAAKAAEERKQNPEPKKKDGEKSSFATWFDSAGRATTRAPSSRR